MNSIGAGIAGCLLYAILQVDLSSSTLLWLRVSNAYTLLREVIAPLAERSDISCPGSFFFFSSLKCDVSDPSLRFARFSMALVCHLSVVVNCPDYCSELLYF